jgi:MFS family permease
MLPSRLFHRRVFVGGNLVWLLACMTSWGAVMFVALALQTTLALRPFIAGLVLTPIYLVMMLGSPLSGRLTERLGPRSLILAGLAIYAVGLWLLHWIGPASNVLTGVLPGILVMAVGMATFSTPLTAATLAGLDGEDQGVASGVNNVASQLAGLMAIVVFPAAAGLAGKSITSPAFVSGFQTAVLAATGLAVAALVLAAVTFGLPKAPAICRPWPAAMIRRGSRPG